MNLQVKGVGRIAAAARAIVGVFLHKENLLVAIVKDGVLVWDLNTPA